jgi:superoxide reductase
MKVGELYQTADWKSEKHVPVIECPDAVKADDMFEVKVSIGKEIAHPNTTEHHIRWIDVFFKPDGDKFAYQVAHCEFTAHGESVEGADKGPVYTHHGATVT